MQVIISGRPTVHHFTYYVVFVCLCVCCVHRERGRQAIIAALIHSWSFSKESCGRRRRGKTQMSARKERRRERRGCWGALKLDYLILDDRVRLNLLYLAVWWDYTIQWHEEGRSTYSEKWHLILMCCFLLLGFVDCMIKYQADRLQSVTDNFFFPCSSERWGHGGGGGFIVERRSLRASKYNFNTTKIIPTVGWFYLPKGETTTPTPTIYKKHWN